jgi:hypothetical protein
MNVGAMNAGPLWEYAVEFHLPGVQTLPRERAQRLAWAFGAALNGAVADARVLRAFAGRDRVVCVLIAPTEGAVHAALSHAHLAPDRVFGIGPSRVGPARAGRTPRGPRLRLVA